MKIPSEWQRTARDHWVGYAVALVVVAFVSIAIGLVARRTEISNLSMLNLVVVVVIARYYGSGPAILASVAAYIIYDWFFVEPLFGVGGTDPTEWLELLLFLVTAVFTGQLAAEQRRRARQAEQREREAVVLCEVLRLLGDLDLDRALSAVAERLREKLGLAAVGIELADEKESPVRAASGDMAVLPEPFAPASVPADPAAAGESPIVSPPRVPGPREERALDPLLVPVKSQDRLVGVLLLVPPAGAPAFDAARDRLVSAVAAQLGHALERRRLRRDATEAEILRRSDELKNALLNAVSHDLRTPLSSIMASGESLLEKDVEWTEQDRDEFAGAIIRETQRLNRIVGNLLDLSRIEGGSLRPKLDWYPLGTLVREVLGRLRPITAQHVVTVEIEKDLPPVLLDYLEIDQVLSNLVENAATDSPVGTELRVSAWRDGEEIRVEVADHGPGVPPESAHLLFRPFHRLHGTGSQPGGVGLGLAVAKGLVEVHGGRIWAENRPGGGIRFIFALPAHSATVTSPSWYSCNGRPSTSSGDRIPMGPQETTS